MSKIFIAGLTPGNGIIEKDKREGTMVAAMRHDLWSANPGDPEAMLAIGVSDANGEFLAEVDDLPVGTLIRVHIREFGYKYLGFDIPADEIGVTYAARLEPDPAIPDNVLERKYEHSVAVRKNWKSEEEFQNALRKVFSFREGTKS